MASWRPCVGLTTRDGRLLLLRGSGVLKRDELLLLLWLWSGGQKHLTILEDYMILILRYNVVLYRLLLLLHLSPGGTSSRSESRRRTDGLYTATAATAGRRLGQENAGAPLDGLDHRGLRLEAGHLIEDGLVNDTVLVKAAVEAEIAL